MDHIAYNWPKSTKTYNEYYNQITLWHEKSKNIFHDNGMIQLNFFFSDNNMTREDFLANIGETTTQYITHPTGNDGDDGSIISWGLVIPIILIGVFLVCVASCLYWHSWRDKNRNQHNVDRSVNTSFERFSRSTGRTPTRVDYVRGSTRSTTPLNIRESVKVVPLTNSNPRQFKFYWDKDNWKLCPPDGSMPPGALTDSRLSLHRQHLSPIDEMDSSALYSSTTKSYDVEAQPPFSPYHLTWLAPKAPPPSYEESELSSPDKSQRIMMSNNTTETNNTCSGYTGYSKNTTNNTCSGCTGYSKNNTSENTCSGYTGYSMKNINSPFYPNNNTPTTDFEFASEQGSLPPKMTLMLHSNCASNANSRFISYPSTPLSSSMESLTESQVDTIEEISYRQHNLPHNRNSHYNSDTDNNRNSQFSQYKIEIDHNRNSIIYNNTENHNTRDNQFSNYNTETDNSTRNSQYEEEYSMGVPSLPSSILFYHQKMTTANVVMSGKTPRFSPHAFNSSQVSSLESSDTCYTDNTSMLPCVGSSITSGNPTGIGISSLQHTNSNQHSMTQNATETTDNINPEDLSKIVDELSSIRPGSNEPPSVNHGVVNSMCGFEGNVGQSYVADIYPPQHGVADSKVHQNMTELFRSWSVTAELDYNSLSSRRGMSMQTPLNEGPFSWDTYPLKKNKGVHNENGATDVNHNVVNINSLPHPGRHVQFAQPILVDKTYWV